MKRRAFLWYPILLAARRAAKASPEGKITRQALSEEAKITPGAASSWLGKLCRWGYASRAGSYPSGGRWGRLYELTKYGAERGPSKGRATFPKPTKKD